jgi:hypothetical protein
MGLITAIAAAATKVSAGLLPEIPAALGTFSPPTAAAAAPATFASGVMGAAVFGIGVGTVIDWHITNVRGPGRSLGESFYNFLHPEENLPAYDPTKGTGQK